MPRRPSANCSVIRIAVRRIRLRPHPFQRTHARHRTVRRPLLSSCARRRNFRSPVDDAVGTRPTARGCGPARARDVPRGRARPLQRRHRADGAQLPPRSRPPGPRRRCPRPPPTPRPAQSPPSRDLWRFDKALRDHVLLSAVDADRGVDASEGRQLTAANRVGLVRAELQRRTARLAVRLHEGRRLVDDGEAARPRHHVHHPRQQRRPRALRSGSPPATPPRRRSCGCSCASSPS